LCNALAKKIYCTTPCNTTSTAVARAREMSVWFQAEYLPREKQSIKTMFAETGASVLVVADEQPVIHHWLNPHQALFFHPGMALQRIRAVQNGERDRLLHVAGMKPGDSVLDATLGQGQDALVFAHCVGERGRVEACERSWTVGRLFQFAQAHMHPYPTMKSQIERVAVSIGNHYDWLVSMADESVDVVYFDPMFRKPSIQESDLDTLRAFAYPQPLGTLAWSEACRVARRAVVLKERPTSGEFERFGLKPDKPRARIAYGVWLRDGEK